MSATGLAEVNIRRQINGKQVADINTQTYSNEDRSIKKLRRKYLGHQNESQAKRQLEIILCILIW
jgi:hypothetical protein